MQEFIEFQSRLENSLQKMVADREMIRLEFLKEDSVSRAINWLLELELGNLKYDGKATAINFFFFSIGNHLLNWTFLC